MISNRSEITNLYKKLKNTGFAHIFGAGVINQMVAFVSGILLVRVIPKAEYGVYSYTNNILSFFMLASGLGAISGILQICSEKYSISINSARSVYRYGFKLGLIFNLFLSILIAVSSFFLKLRFPTANMLLLLLSFIPIFSIVNELIQIYFRYNKLNTKYSYYSTLNSILILLFALIGAVIWSANGLILFRYIGYVLSFAIGISLLKFPLKDSFKTTAINEYERKDFFRISLISMVNNSTAHLLFIADIFIIGLIIPDESVIASYKVATIIPNALVFIPNALMVYVYPYFAEHNVDKKWVRDKYLSIVKYFGIFNILLSAFLVIFAPLIIKLVFGAEYLDATTPFRILSVAYFISSTFRKVSGNLLVTQRKLKFNFVLGLIEGVLNIIMNVILISNLGSVGASIASVIAVLFTSIISTLYFNNIIR